MRTNSHDRLFLTCSVYVTLGSFLMWSMAAIVPPAAQAAEPSLGMATGSKEAQIATDGKQWATLSASSNPVYEGTMIRTGKGAASVLLKDGSQLELQPRTVVGLFGSRSAPVVKIAVGQVLFRLSASSHAAFVTPTVRYQAADAVIGEQPSVLKAKAATLSVADPVGKIVVNREGGSRIGLQQGEMFAKSANDPGLHIVKAGQSVYIPQVGGAVDPGFGVMLAQALPGEAGTGPGANLPDTNDYRGDEAPIVGTGTSINTETAVGLAVGLGAIGAGIGLGVNSSGKPSPSTP